MGKDPVVVASACQGKQQFPSKQAIFRIFTRPGREKPVAFKCKVCGHYHVAHQKGRPAVQRKALRRYINLREKFNARRNKCTTT